MNVAIVALIASLSLFCSKDYEKNLDIRVSQIPHAGNGVYAKTPISKGTYLGSYKGKFINKEEHRRLVKEKRWHYTMKLLDCAIENTGGYGYIDGISGNVFSRINYAPSEFQNVKFEKICDPPYVKIIAIRDIRLGDELYIDYGARYVYDFMEDEDVIKFFRDKERTLNKD